MPQAFKRRLLKLKFLTKPLIVAGFLLVMVYCYLKFIAPVYQFMNKNNLSPQFFISLAKGKEIPIKKYKERTNIIILGTSGGENEGFDLTDTIIFLSIDFSKNDVLMQSIPRDLWLSSLKAKINTAYHYGEAKKNSGGMSLAKAAVEEVVGQPIHYGLLIDFSGFKKIIDTIEGIDIDVEKGFVDKEYPIFGKENDFCAGDPKFACRYETVQFEKGLQHMDGERALKYVRSRHAEDEEGTDFARDKRQQQVILAVKNKILSYPLWKEREKIKEMASVINNMIHTDMRWSEKIILLKFFYETPTRKIRHLVLDSGDAVKERKGFLVNPPVWKYDGLWVLEPRTGNFEEIQKYILCQIENPDCPITP